MSMCTMPDDEYSTYRDHIANAMATATRSFESARGSLTEQNTSTTARPWDEGTVQPRLSPTLTAEPRIYRPAK